MSNLDFEWLCKNRASLYAEYQGKHLAIIDGKVVGVGDSAIEAFKEARKKDPKTRPLLTYLDSPDPQHEDEIDT